MVRLSTSASHFLKRFDALEEVTIEHPLFLGPEPEDLPPETDNAYGLPYGNPIHINSYKKRVRELAAKHLELEKTLPRKLSKYSYQAFKNTLVTSVRSICQLFRPFWFILFTYKFLHTAFSCSLDQCPISLTIYCLLSIHFAVSFAYDDMFKREFLNYTSEVKSGTYYNKNDPNLCKLVEKIQHLNGEKPYKSTPWLYNGDLRTLFPFISFSPAKVDYIRRWVFEPGDKESFAVDIAFPKRKVIDSTVDGEQEYYFDPNLPLILVLHGINGGSTEGYLLDFINHHNAQGYTVCALVGRGLMGTPMMNGCIFNGSRTTDIEAAINCFHAACGNMTVPEITNATATPGSFTKSTAFIGDVMNQYENRGQWQTPICVAGFSVGGILLAKYAVRTGKRSGLASGVSFSAVGDSLVNCRYTYGVETWHHWITSSLKDNYIGPYQYFLAYPGGYAKKPIDIDAIDAAIGIHEFDQHFSTDFLGYKDFESYYREMSFAIAMDDGRSRLANLYTPLFVIHADDDPILSVDTLKLAVDYVEDELSGASIKTNSDQESYFVMLITRGGGHVGCPTGWNPAANRWEYLNSAATQFFTASQEVFVAPDQVITT